MKKLMKYRQTEHTVFDEKVVKWAQIDSRVKKSWADHPKGLRAEHSTQGPSATKEEAFKEAIKEATG